MSSSLDHKTTLYTYATMILPPQGWRRLSQSSAANCSPVISVGLDTNFLIVKENSISTNHNISENKSR